MSSAPGVSAFFVAPLRTTRDDICSTLFTPSNVIYFHHHTSLDIVYFWLHLPYQILLICYYVHIQVCIFIYCCILKSQISFSLSLPYLGFSHLLFNPKCLSYTSYELDKSCLSKKIWLRCSRIKSCCSLTDKKTQSNHLYDSLVLVSLGKWLSVRLRAKWLWFRVLLQSLKLQISRLFRARSSLIFRQL